MVTGEARSGSVFDFEPEDFVGDEDRVGNDEARTVAGDIEGFAEEHTVDKEDDAGGKEEEEQALRGAAESLTMRSSADGESEESDEHDVFDPVGELVVDEGPEDLSTVVAFEGPIESFKNGEVEGIPEGAGSRPKKGSN